MILKKPYVFFIKMFKPIHLAMAVLVMYLIFLNNKVLSFLTEYLHSSIDILGSDVKEEIFTNLLYIIPIIIMILSFIILGVMFKKNKPIKFYFINIFIFIVVIVINFYASNFLSVMEESIVAIKSVKLIHDLVLINVALESFVFILLLIRGMGINFKKFNFDSDISKFNIEESDNEEIEIDINVNLDETKRKRKKTFRYFKYTYLENKFMINTILISSILILGISVYFVISSLNKVNKEGVIYQANTFSFGVDNTIILNTDYKGDKLTDNYLIVINTKIKSNANRNSLYLNDFNLKIGSTIFKPSLKYSNSLIDLGILYNEEILSKEYTNYLFVYEIEEKYITSDMIFSYNNMGNSIGIKLDPKNLIDSNEVLNKNINEEISFDKILGDIKFKINDFDIKDKYILEYNYCIEENDCVKSLEYLKASIDKNYDKYILKLDIEYSDNSDLKLENFYEFLSKFGRVYYKLNDTWYIQNVFEEIKSKKINIKNTEYIGVKSDISGAESIKLVFNIRGSRYEYLLK